MVFGLRSSCVGFSVLMQYSPLVFRIEFGAVEWRVVIGSSALV